MNRNTWRVARFVVLIAVVAIGLIVSQLPDQGAAPPGNPPDTKPTAERAEKQAETDSAVVRDVTVKDLNGDTAYQGDVDLAATLTRIDGGKRLKFRNDGSVFENREKRLPAKASGYYREWVHLTPGLTGPGPQRVVVGAEGEAYYTPDHYRTFEKIR